MMKRNTQRLLFALVLPCLLMAGCTDSNPVAESPLEAAEGTTAETAAKTQKDKKFLKNIRTTGTLADGGTFKGKVTITEFGYDETLGLTVSGFLQGTATTADGTEYEDTEQAFSNIPATLNEECCASAAASKAGAAQAECQILFLDIGPIFLDLLGLQVDLSEIILDITAVSGAGNLLGNLLCAVAGLLDPSGFLDQLIGTLTDLLDLLNQLNNLIG